MQYQGSKRRIAKEILPIILENRQEGQLYVEPFVGGCNSIQHVTGRRWGNDSHKELIAMWVKLLQGWAPPETISEEEYMFIKSHKHLFEDHLLGIVGFGASFGAKWWGGYARSNEPDYTPSNTRFHQFMRSLMKQLPLLDGVTFTNLNYEDMVFKEKSVIYCDPPYANTTKYKHSFDSDKFFEWCREKSSDGHTVFVSEYSAPKDFKCVFEKSVHALLNNNVASTKANITEKLYKV